MTSSPFHSRGAARPLAARGFFSAANVRSAALALTCLGALSGGCEEIDGDLDADLGPVLTPDGGGYDAGISSDASRPFDASNPSDTGVWFDASGPFDASIPVDATSSDAGAPDGSAPDGSTPDGSTPDGSVRDSGTPDGSAPDASTPDASVPDASVPNGSGPPANKLPTVKGACPALRNGTVSVAGSQVKLWVGPAGRPGPMVFYFHGTGTTADEVNQGLSGAVDDVTRNGGIVASWDASNSQGESTGNVWAVWFTGDFDAADQILACGLQNGLIDPARIHVSGYSAGGLQTGAMLFMRSNYIASGIVYSGGKGFGASGFQDPSNVPNAVMAHGAAGSDALILDFNEWSTNLGTEIKRAGGFVIDCNDGGGHVNLSRLGIQGKAWQFMKDHPYKKKPSPYASGLSGWPNYCKIW